MCVKEMTKSLQLDAATEQFLSCHFICGFWDMQILV